MTRRIPWSLALVVAVAAFSITGCGKKAAPPVEEPVTPPTSSDQPVETPPARDETVKYEDPNQLYPGVFSAIYFDFNKFTITDAAKPKLERIATALKDKPTWKILVEGHCDERGTNEYNMGLGEQRALATKRYLVSLGVSETRFQTVSYGEERPVDGGHSESAWAKNRRSEFRVEVPRS